MLSIIALAVSICSLAFVLFSQRYIRRREKDAAYRAGFTAGLQACQATHHRIGLEEQCG